MPRNELVLANRQDVSFLHRCYVSRDIRGPFQPCRDVSEETVMHEISISPEIRRFVFIVKQDACAIGYAYAHYVSAFDHYEVGATLVPSVRGKGIGIFVHQTLVEMMFDMYRARRLQAFVSAKNLAEIKVMERCGFTKEGVLRAGGFLDGVWHDLAVYGLLSSDNRRVVL